MGQLQAEPTLSLAANGFSNPYNVEGTTRCRVTIYVSAVGDAAGDFYIVTRATPNAPWERHASHTVARTATTELTKHFTYTDRCGAEIAIEWVKSAGATGTALLYLQAD